MVVLLPSSAKPRSESFILPVRKSFRFNSLQVVDQSDWWRLLLKLTNFIILIVCRLKFYLLLVAIQVYLIWSWLSKQQPILCLWGSIWGPGWCQLDKCINLCTEIWFSGRKLKLVSSQECFLRLGIWDSWQSTYSLWLLLSILDTAKLNDDFVQTNKSAVVGSEIGDRSQAPIY